MDGPGDGAGEQSCGHSFTFAKWKTNERDGEKVHAAPFEKSGTGTKNKREKVHAAPFAQDACRTLSLGPFVNRRGCDGTWIRPAPSGSRRRILLRPLELRCLGWRIFWRNDLAPRRKQPTFLRSRLPHGGRMSGATRAESGRAGERESGRAENGERRAESGERCAVA